MIHSHHSYWKHYIGAFDLSPMGLFRVNLQSLLLKFDCSAKDLEVDLLGFVPSWDRTIGKEIKVLIILATPLVFKRTPGRSVSRSALRNVLRTSISVGSGLGTNFTKTPLTLKEKELKPSLSSHANLEPVISKLLQFHETNSNEFLDSVPPEISFRVANITSKYDSFNMF